MSFHMAGLFTPTVLVTPLLLWYTMASNPLYLAVPVPPNVWSLYQILYLLVPPSLDYDLVTRGTSILYLYITPVPLYYPQYLYITPCTSI